jgi:trehalose 6-phosphate synthase/phosphatase
MRLLIVSNRLPITVEKKEGKLILKESSGGLVSGLSSYLDSLKGSSFPSKADYIWIGWTGIEIENKDQDDLKSKLLTQYKAYSVFLSKNVMENFYQGFCNKTIWPLFHYFPSYAVYEEEFWNCYKLVNEIFLDSIMEIIKPDDLIWIHDYHLMLLPKLIRKKMPGIRIGFFLHIPFPTYEIFSLMPGKWRVEILEGLLGADIIGFHTYDYTQYFLRCVLRILGIDSDMGNLIVDNGLVKADTFPMGIDYQKFQKSLQSIEVQNNLKDLKKQLNYEKVILSIDRLDYSKGILNRLQGYELFLEKNPHWLGKIILILRVVPSRIGVKHYRKMKKQIDEFVGRINGKFGSINWTPISYQYGFLPFNPLVALYSVSDIILVTPLRDGMNLISKEYIACRKDKIGVLILSEMAGSSKELGEALLINPNNIEEITSAIHEAIEMPAKEQIRRNEIMQERIKRYDVVKWADDFIQKITSVGKDQERLKSRLLNEIRIEQLLNDFKRAKNRLIFLDYDGTLVPFVKHPGMAKPEKELLNLICSLAKNKRNDIILISGRDKDTLQKWFNVPGLEIIAEHGAWLKEKKLPKSDWRMIKPLVNNWKPQIYSILEMYADRLPGSFIEEKEFSLAWHYRGADPELASIRTRELLDYLLSYTANIDIQVLQGNRVIEIRNYGVNKGTAGLNWISKNKYDFIMAIGDDWTDEDLFKILPDSSYSIKVGLSYSHSKFYLQNHTKVIELLNQLLHI